MVFSLFLATACDDNDGPNDGPIEPVTEVRAESFIGSVNVYFKAPQNENYYYTLITYDDSEGKTKHLKVGKDALDSETGLMKAVVTDGTASALASNQYTAAGKTGSAEFGTNKGDSHAWFVGYANAKGSSPIAIAVVVEGAGNGSTISVPIAKSVFDTYFK